MTKDEAIEIIRNEKLDDSSFFSDVVNINEIGIKKIGNQWEVYTTDERAYKDSCEYYMFESEALDDYIERLRADKKYWELVKKREGLL